MALSSKWEAFRVDDVARGLDHQRTQYQTAYGTWVASSSTTFEAGMLVELSSAGEVVKATGLNPILGVAKENKATSFYASVVGETIQLTGTTAASLDHATLFDPSGGGTGGGVRVYIGATTYTEGAGSDYTVSYTNGTVVRTAGSTIPTGSTVSVDYMYQMTAAELQRDGSNFWNKDDDVTIRNNKLTVIQGPATIFTMQYDHSVAWAVGTLVYAGEEATDGEGGLWTDSSGTGTVLVGKVIQVPTASDPYLGVRMYQS